MALPNELLLRLWPRGDSVAIARHAVHSFCTHHALAPFADDAALLTSELVSNAIRHSGGLITLVALSRDGSLTVNVRDAGDGDDKPIAMLPTPTAESGRGLFVVDAVASEWGTTPHPDGTSVWFRLSRARTLATDADHLDGRLARSEGLEPPTF